MTIQENVHFLIILFFIVNTSPSCTHHVHINQSSLTESETPIAIISQLSHPLQTLLSVMSDEEIVTYSKDQRQPKDGEPSCVVILCYLFCNVDLR